MTIEEALSSSFWTHAHALAAARGTELSHFARDVANSVLQAGLSAIEDHHSGTARYQVVSAPTGGGKSSYAWVLIKAVLGTIDNSSVVFLCETVDQCEDTYRELRSLLSDGQLAIWTSSHDIGACADQIERERGFRPSAQFARADLERHRAIVVTHAFYQGARGEMARSYNGSPRMLTIIDERPQEVSVFDIDQGDVAKARDWALTSFGLDSEPTAAFQQLHDFVEGVWETERTLKTNFRAVRNESIQWFDTEEAKRVMRECSEGPVAQVIGFAQACGMGYAFMSRYDSSLMGGRFVGYKMSMPVVPGAILLDATSDIDGVSQIAAWRSPVPTPQLSFKNLTVTHIAPPEKIIGPRERVSQIVRTAKRARPYAEWIRETILQHTVSGEKVLAVVHKGMLAHDYLPDNSSFGADGFKLEGREVAFINWGYGIGSNRWKEASSVFLFGEFHLPKRTTVATAFGLLDQPAGSTALQKVQCPASKEPTLTALQVGHLLRWEKQLAMRGNARNISRDGVCGEQKLFVTAEFKRFHTHREALFPGAAFFVDPSVHRRQAKGTVALARLLATSNDFEMTSLDVKKLTGVDMSKNGARLLKDEGVKAAMEHGDWRWVPSAGGRAKPSSFQRWF